MSRRGSHGLLSLVYFHNPFYLISTCLFVYGLKLFFRSGNTRVFFDAGSIAYMEPWGLMASLAAVTLLMAITAVLVVRCGRVWEDARSLVLIVLLMLLAISVSFDELITVLSDRDNSSRHVYAMFGVGAGFALFVTEFLLWGLKVRLHAAYRLPLLGFLLLFSLWPIGLLTELTEFSIAQTRLLIVAFPLAAAVLTLLLVPAVRLGRKAVEQNGTPWKWPLFPWTPFIFLGLAVFFRSYSLTMSYDPKANGHYWDTIFGIYQLVPFLLAVLVLMLEIAIKENIAPLRNAVLLTAPALLALAYPWLVPWSQLPTYAAFVRLCVADVASPVFLTLLGLLLFYSWAWLRGIRSAEAGIVFCTLLLTFIPADAFSTQFWQPSVEQINMTPLLCVGGCYFALSLWTRHSFRFLIGLGILTLAFGTSDSLPESVLIWRRTAILHTALLSLVVVSLSFKDRFADFCRELTPLIYCLALLTGIYEMNRIGGLPLLVSYCTIMACISLLLGLLMGESFFKVLAVIQFSILGVGACGGGLYYFVNARMAPGVKPIVLAVASFLGAICISTLKAGFDRRIRLFLLRRKRAEP